MIHEVVKTIDSMSLEELKGRAYICNKFGRDPVKCIDCNELSGCPVGKRVVEIIDEMTGEKKLSKWEKGGATKHEKHHEIIKKAIESGNPVRYLMDVEGSPNIRAARERLRKAKLLYPDLFENEVKDTTIKKKTSADLKEDWKNASAYSDPVKWYMEKYQIDQPAAYQRWRRAKLKFGDIPVPAVEETNEDEVTLEDFLKQHGMTTAEWNVKAGTAVDITPKEDEKREEVQDNSFGGSSFDKTYQDLIAQRDRLQSELKKVEDILKSFDLVKGVIQKCELTNRTFV